MNKNLLTAFLFGASVFAATSTFVSCKDYDPDIKAVQESVNATNSELKKNVESMTKLLTEQKAALDAELASIKSTYDTKIAEAKAALEQADADNKAALEASISSLESKLAQETAARQADINTVNAAIEDLKGADEAINGKITDLQALVSANATDIAAISAKVAEIQTAVTDLNARLTVAEGAITSLDGKVDANYAALKAMIDANKADADAKIADALSKIADETTRAKAAEEANKLAVEAEKAAREAADITINATIAANKTASENADAALQAAIDAEIAARTAADSKLAEQQAEIAANVAKLVDAHNTLALAVAKNAEDITAETAARVAAVQDLQTQINTLKDEKIPALEAALEGVATRVGTLEEHMTAAEAAIQELKDGLSTLTVYVEKTITSLVYKPTSYLYGFPTIDVTSLANLPKYKVVKYESANGKAAIEYTEDGQCTYAPDAHAYYHLNPTSADITKYTFAFADVETENILTRANDTKSINPAVKETAVKDGILDVTFNIGAPQNLNDAVAKDGKAWVSTLALQATIANEKQNAGSTVTSDYAIVVPQYYKQVSLRNDGYQVDGEYTNMLNANENCKLPANCNDKNIICSIPDWALGSECLTFKVAYNKTIDLKDVITTHYAYSNTPDGDDIWGNFNDKKNSKKNDYAALQAKGLRYEFEILKVWKNNVATAMEAGVVSTEGITGAKDASNKYIGSTYVVVVKLMTAKDEILAVGNVKILVTDVEAAAATAETALTIDCENKSLKLGLKDIVAQFAENYSGSLDVDKFLATYDLVPTIVLNDKKMYNVEFTENDCFVVKDKELYLNLTAATINALYLESIAGDQKMPSYYRIKSDIADLNLSFKFTPKEGKTGYSELEVKVTIPADKVNYIADGTVANSDKIKAYWYERNTKTLAETNNQFNDIHANVATPSLDNEPSFDFNILNTFAGGDATMTLTPKIALEEGKKLSDVFSSLPSTTAMFVFDTAEGGHNNRLVMGASKTPYDLYPEPTKIIATPKGTDPDKEGEIIVELFNNELVINKESEIAKDILNAYGKNDIAKTFDVLVNMQSSDYCYAVNAGQFYVKLLRPININNLESAPKIDGMTGAATWMIENLVELSDWRVADDWFGKTAATKQVYTFGHAASWTDAPGSSAWTFYGVEKNAIKPVTKDVNGKIVIVGATTDINGKIESLDKVAPNVMLTWDAAETGAHLDGAITYVNNKSIVNQTFHVYVPVTLEYYWGKIPTTLTLTIDSTINQAKRR